jgi:hypothetical protein
VILLVRFQTRRHSVQGMTTRLSAKSSGPTRIRKSRPEAAVWGSEGWWGSRLRLGSGQGLTSGLPFAVEPQPAAQELQQRGRLGARLSIGAGGETDGDGLLPRAG